MKNKSPKQETCRLRISTHFLKKTRLILLVGILLSLPAIQAYSQQEKISVEIRNTTLRDALREIEKKSGKKLFMSDDMAALNKTVFFKASNKKFEQVMNEILKGTGLTYQIMDNGSVVILVNNSSPIKITGIVRDAATGEPLIGGTVKEKGNDSNGVLTDLDGKFQLNVANEKSVLVFNYLGYKEQSKVVGKNTSLNIKLAEDAQLLNEVVVVGYGSMRKSDLTGTIASFKAKDIVEKGYTSMEQMLQGQIAGVQITANSGATAAGMTFNIRGATSPSGNNQPLIVIDGYPINSDDSQTKMSGGSQSGYLGTIADDNALAGINPNDIESIEILKDASATAIYGSRGANGVVLITTKRGQAGKNSITYSYRVDFSSVPKKLDVLSTKDYVDYINEANVNRTGTLHSLYNTQEKIDALKETNWQDLIFRTGVSHNHSILMSGGDEKMKYALSGSYLTQEGIIEQSKFNRGSIRFNFEREFSKKFKFGVNISGSMTKNDAAQSASDKGEPSMSVIIAALKTRPTLTPYTDDELIDQSFTGNPYALVYLAEDINKSTNMLANMYGVYTVLPELSMKLRGGMERGVSHRDYYHPKGTTLGNVNNGYAYSGDSDRQNYSWEYTLNFNKTFNKKHKINAVAGYEYQKWESRNQGVNALGFPSDKMLYYNLGSAETFPAPSTSRSEDALSSFLFRLNYAYDSKYLLTLTGRADGSTRLAKGNQWDFFPSVGLGWNVHKENFMKSFDALDQLKMRFSWGLSGSRSIGIGASQLRYGTTTTVINQSASVGYIPSNIVDPSLGWETTSQLNVGLDLAFLRSSLRFTFDYYRKDTEDLLLNLPLPPSMGYGNYPTNNGKIRNSGYEFSLGATPFTGEFKWDINANVSINRNKVLDLGEVEVINSSFAAIGNQTTNIAKVGLPLGVFYGYRIDGIWQTQEEIDASGITDATGIIPGSFKYRDLNGDKKIDEEDREVIGDPYPDFTFGINNAFSWKSLSLTFLVTGSIGQDVINANRHFLDGLVTSSDYNVSREAWENRWTGPGTSNTYPRPSTPNQTGAGFGSRFTDFIVEDASYVRLKTLSLSYACPSKLMPFINAAKIFVTATNLLTFTNYKGYDPEVNSRAGKGMRPGIDNGGIPQYRTYSFGLSVSF